MKEPISNYWKIRLENIAKALEKNNFEVYLVADGAAVKDLQRVKVVLINEDLGY